MLNRTIPTATPAVCGPVSLRPADEELGMPSALLTLLTLLASLPVPVPVSEDAGGGAVARPAAMAQSIEVCGSAAGVATSATSDVVASGAVETMVVDVLLLLLKLLLLLLLLLLFWPATTGAAAALVEVGASVAVKRDDVDGTAVAELGGTTAVAVVVHGPAPALSILALKPAADKQNSPLPTTLPSVHR